MAQDSSEAEIAGISDKARFLLDFIKKVAPGSERVGNVHLRASLQAEGTQWTEDEYWAAQEELRDVGLIAVGRGRGGSLWLQEPVTTAKDAAGLVDDEADLYKPFVNWLDGFYGRAAKEREDFFLPKITASPSGRKRESGLWSRPDVSLVQVNRFDYVPTPQLEVSSFEIKRFDEAAELDSIYEAAAHSRWVHNSWLVAEDSEATPRGFSKRFLTELERFGVGLIRMKKQQDESYRFEVELDPRYIPPDPEELDEFLGTFFTEEGGKMDTKGLKRFKAACG